MTNTPRLLDGLTTTARFSFDDIALVVGATRQIVAEWSTGAAEPSPDSLARLLALSAAATQVAGALGLRPAETRNWMTEPNHLLGSETPLQRLAEGRFRDVLAVIEGLADGIVP